MARVVVSRSQPMTLETAAVAPKAPQTPGRKNRIRAREALPMRREVSTTTATAVSNVFPDTPPRGLGDRQGCWQGRGKGVHDCQVIYTIELKIMHHDTVCHRRPGSLQFATIGRPRALR